MIILALVVGVFVGLAIGISLRVYAHRTWCSICGNVLTCRNCAREAVPGVRHA